MNDHVSIRSSYPLSTTGRLAASLGAVACAKAMSSHRKTQREEIRFRVLRLLEENPEMSQRDLADAVGVSVGGMHYVLSALVEKGFVKLGSFSAAKDKRRYAYLLTPKGLAEKAVLTRAFLARKRAEYAALREEIAALAEEVGDDSGERDVDATR